VKGKRIGVDASTMEANAALRTIVRRDDGRTYREMLRQMAKESGIDTPSADDLIRLDRARKGKKLSNEEWTSKTDPEAKIAKLKDGRTHLAYKPEHAVDLDTGIIVAAALHPADEGDTTTLEEALSRYGKPEIFNTDQGSQFTGDGFTGTLKRHEITISMDGKGRYVDNIFVERLWRSLKYEEVYLNAYVSVAEAKAGIGSWLSFYNEERQHQSLGYRTPRQAYQAECRWICGRSATPTGGAFAHIPTGTTATHRIDVDKGEDRNDVMTVAPAAIGAGTEIGRATP
jgi:transposase InsO family protein